MHQEIISKIIIPEDWHPLVLDSHKNKYKELWKQRKLKDSSLLRQVSL